jgi:hypothetical protein
MARRCVYCGGLANSKEHAIPDWLTGLIPGAGAFTHRRENPQPVTWRASGFDVLVRQVCKTCNEGWMSELETRSKDLISELVLDTRSAPLGHAEQIAVATWIFKTSTMLALAYPEEHHHVPLEDYRFFYEHRKPPDGTTIFIASLYVDANEGDQVYVGWTKPERLDYGRRGVVLEPHGYRLSLSVFLLIAQVLRDPHGGRFERPRAYRDVWTRVRPISKGNWPPGRRIPHSQLEDVADGKLYTGAEP